MTNKEQFMLTYYVSQKKEMIDATNPKYAGALRKIKALQKQDKIDSKDGLVPIRIIMEPREIVRLESDAEFQQRGEAACKRYERYTSKLMMGDLHKKNVEIHNSSTGKNNSPEDGTFSILSPSKQDEVTLKCGGVVKSVAKFLKIPTDFYGPYEYNYEYDMIQRSRLTDIYTYGVLTTEALEISGEELRKSFKNALASQRLNKEKS